MSHEKVQNRPMREGLQKGTTVDVSRWLQEDGTYVIPHDDYDDGKDYCNAGEEAWIWSIGRCRATGVIRAAHDARYYQNPDYECLWLR